jgi:hypothetical protein
MGPIVGEAPAPRNQGTKKMTIKRTLTSITTAVALAATALVPMATSANAQQWPDHRRDYGFQNAPAHDYSYRSGNPGDRGGNRGNWDGRGRDGGRHDFYAYRRHKHHDNGKYIALGVGALMLGIMASEASHY